MNLQIALTPWVKANVNFKYVTWPMQLFYYGFDSILI